MEINPPASQTKRNVKTFLQTTNKTNSSSSFGREKGMSVEEVFTPLGLHVHVLLMKQSLTACTLLKVPFHNEKKTFLTTTYPLLKMITRNTVHFQENTVMLINNTLFTDQLHIFLYTKSKVVFTRWLSQIFW